MKKFIVTADVIGTQQTRDAVIHCIGARCGDHAELALRQHYPDAVRVRAVNAREADARRVSTATQLEAHS